LRKGPETTFRIAFVNRPATLTEPLTLVFGIQATPIKPLPDGWRAWMRALSLFEPSMHKDWPTKEWPKGCLFNTCASNGRGRRESPQCCGTVHPTDEAESRAYVDEFHGRGTKVFMYINLRSTGFNDREYKDYEAEWGTIPGRPGHYAPVESYRDYALWCLKDWVASCSLDGLYLDDVFPVPSENLVNGCGWVDDAGVLHAGYSLFHAREYVKRLAVMLDGLGRFPRIRIHTTNTPFTPYLGFGCMFMDGELHGFPDPNIKDPDYVDRWPYEQLDRFRSTTWTKQFGVVPVRLVRGFARKLDEHSAEALCLLHDIFWFSSAHTYIVWGLSQFRIWEDDVQFFPYWDVREPVKVKASMPKVLASAWRRKDRGMVIVSNLDAADAVADVTLDPAQFGLKGPLCAVDGVTQKPVALSDWRIEDLAVARHGFKLVLIGAPGVFFHGDGTFGKDLPGPAEVIEQEADDFSVGLPSAWSVAVSPESPRGTVITWNDRMRVVTKRNRYAFASRDFGLDNVSVQCCIEVESPENTGPTHGPALMLYWENGNFAKAGLALAPQVLRAEEPLYAFYVNNALVKGPAMPMHRETFYLWKNWVKIALTAETVDFYCSTDGETWRKAHSVERGKRLAGAPARLVLGCGHGSKQAGNANDFLMNDRAGKTLEGYRFHHFSRVVIGREH
jgi:hypothetical protein